MNDSQKMLHPVSLVGAGPGDPELMTVRALKRIEAADVLLCDALVDPRVLTLARADARVLQVGKRGFKPSTDQRFIHELMIREARKGARVVRLKGGDPFVFGRGGEEADALRAAGIEVEIVSGLTSGLAGPAGLGIPVTDRRCTPGVALVTGHNGEGGRSPDWAALARSGLTLVVYMGVTQAADIAAALLAAGMQADTPAAVVCAAHTAQQREFLCTLATLPDTIAREQVKAPALLVIGEVVALAPAWRAAIEAAQDPAREARWNN
ncbi:uroporphyrinogen-III C-methyltransferase [Paucibacter sp. R3-3]|uniref:uroporphyrinogen-III C-methyltransferase n=1 Tax=Roseateles agri TaxID=3098619 RepID=A0ABU5DCU3_9BURK|nr:uroporphyrinogen-III C-methyltransferase [Paucibacter sp. R3-3]MDY0744107.1 uroporphyrinogen-III C-methyltransferase [Paucibacter sp. R3-3]